MYANLIWLKSKPGDSWNLFFVSSSVKREHLTSNSHLTACLSWLSVQWQVQEMSVLLLLFYCRFAVNTLKIRLNGSSNNSSSGHDFPQLPLPRSNGGRKKIQTSLENTEAAEPTGSVRGRFVKGTDSHERRRRRRRCTCPCSCSAELSSEDSPPCGQTSPVKAAAVRRNVCLSPECGENTPLLPFQRFHCLSTHSFTLDTMWKSICSFSLVQIDRWLNEWLDGQAPYWSLKE